MLKLYHFPASPYGWIARMALAEKGLAYESIQPYDRKDNPELSKHNPVNRTPTLVCDGRPVYESLAIMEFLEERFPEPRLLPADAFQRAEARAIACMAYMDLLPETAKLGRAVLDFSTWDPRSGKPPAFKPADQVDVKARDEALAGAARVLGSIELFARRGEWLSGAFSIADIALTPFVTNLGFRGFTLPAEMPGIAAWHARIRERPSFAASKPPYIP